MTIRDYAKGASRRHGSGESRCLMNTIMIAVMRRIVQVACMAKVLSNWRQIGQTVGMEDAKQLYHGHGKTTGGDTQ
jgi:hypothetical protein